MMKMIMTTIFDIENYDDDNNENRVLQVHTDDALSDPGYRFPLNYGVEKFLEIFSGKRFYLDVEHLCNPTLFFNFS